MRNLILYNQLRLAFAPISAYSFTIEKKYTHFKKLLEFSHLYIIAQRKEICFKHIKYAENPASISFEIHQIGLENILKCHLPLFQKNLADDFKKKVGIACESNNTPKESFNYEKDDIHFLSIIEQEKNGPVNVINRMSPEVFLHNVLKELIVADIKGEVKDFLKYKVHYVGKATEQNICKRLTGHSTLQDILSLEKPMSYGNIPADEIVLLLFEVEDNYSFSQSDMTDLSGKDIVNFINNYELPSSKILSLDAEKALVKAMSPNYNKIRFKSYPSDNDLINIDNHQCIAYRLFDPITLIYQDGKMRGDNLSHFCDFIFVEKNKTPHNN